MNKLQFNTIDEYIATFPKYIQMLLEQMRKTIREAAPDAIEAISYQMPTFKLNGKNLVHFAAFTHHIGFYPTPAAIGKFQEELKPYKTATGSIQFPIDKYIPFDLVRKMVTTRVKQVLGKIE